MEKYVLYKILFVLKIDGHIFGRLSTYVSCLLSVLCVQAYLSIQSNSKMENVLNSETTKKVQDVHFTLERGTMHCYQFN